MEATPADANLPTSELADALVIEPVVAPAGSKTASARALRAAGEILARWQAEAERSPLDRIVSAEFRTRAYLNAGERRWIAEALYYSVRFQNRQHFLLEHLTLPPTPENTVALYAAEQGEDADVVTPTALRDALDFLPTAADATAYLRITQSFPNALADSLGELLGDEATDAADALNRQAPVTLRLNPVRVSRAHALKSLSDARPTRYSPWGLELPRRQNVPEMAGFKQGWFEVQEEASQLVALLTDAQPGQKIADVGAGAGGKTLALAALMENKGEILGVDTHAGRLNELAKRTERAGVTCVETVQVSVDETGDWQSTTSARRALNRWRGKADAVLVDAPCTGSGVVRRSPDGKWRLFDAERVARQQRELLASAAPLVAPGGLLVYVTCAFEREQNEAIIEAFLATQIGQLFAVESAVERLNGVYARAWEQAQSPPFLRTDKARRKLAEKQDAADGSAAHEGSAPVELPDFSTMAAGPYLRTWPHRHGLDAFFAACLRRATA